MYTMWWHKPLLAKEPILVRSELIPTLLPYMYMSSEIGGRIDPRQLQSQTIVKTLIAYLNLYSKVPEIEYICRRQIQHKSPGVPEVEFQIQPTASSTVEITQFVKYECSIIGLDCRKPMREFSMGKESTTAFFERRSRVRIDTSKHFKNTQAAESRVAKLSCMLNNDDRKVLESFSHSLSNKDLCTHFKSEQLLVEYRSELAQRRASPQC